MVKIFTARISVNDPDRVDITISAVEKGKATPEGAAFAPDRWMVSQHKAGKLTDSKYIELYLELLRSRYQKNRAPFLSLLQRDRVVLVCYCPEGAFCHRHIAKEVLIKIAVAHGITASLGGELGDGGAPDGKKAISLWQPWASLLVTGAKRIETRSWIHAYRGRLIIHSAKRFTQEERDIAASHVFAESLGAAGLDPTRLPLGCMVGEADLVDIVPVEKIREDIGDREYAFGNYSNGRFAWIFENPRSYDQPIPARGAQGLFNWRDEDAH